MPAACAWRASSTSRSSALDALLGAGGLDGLSIGFRTVRAQPQRGGLRRLEAIDLWEISLVTFPLQAGARIAAPVQAGAALAQDIRALAHRMAPPRRAASPFTRPGPRPAAILPARPARFA